MVAHLIEKHCRLHGPYSMAELRGGTTTLESTISPIHRELLEDYYIGAKEAGGWGYIGGFFWEGGII